VAGRDERGSLRNERGRKIGEKMLIEARPIAEPPPRALAKARPVDEHAAAAPGSKMFGQRTHFLAARNRAESREQQHGPARPQCLICDLDWSPPPFPWKGAGRCHAIYPRQDEQRPTNSIVSRSRAKPRRRPRLSVAFATPESSVSTTVPQRRQTSIWLGCE
jgi:hypothetical protein